MIVHQVSRTRRLGFAGIGAGDRLATAVGRRLDDDWHWFRSVAPGGTEPIDVVIVGPGGTWSLTFRGERGRFAHRNGHWYRWNRATGSWVPWEAVPVTAARLAGRRLALYLERAALPSMVDAVLVPPHDMSIGWEPRGSAPFIVEREPDRLAAIVSAADRLTGQQVDRIVALLDPRQPLPQLAPSTPRG